MPPTDPSTKNINTEVKDEATVEDFLQELDSNNLLLCRSLNGFQNQDPCLS